MRHDWCRVRTTVVLPEELGERLRAEARRRGMSVAEFTREAIEQALPAPPADGALSIFDIGPEDSSVTDDGCRVDEIVAAAMDRRLDSDRKRR